MPFCMEVIIRTLKDVAFCDPKNDRALGQLLVLLQYQWPKEEEIFASLITTVQKRRRFYFPEFFEYVIRILPAFTTLLYTCTCVYMYVQCIIICTCVVLLGLNELQSLIFWRKCCI